MTRGYVACLAAFISLFALPASARIADYATLKAEGYKTGTLTQNRAGNWGWHVSGKSETLFCRLSVGLVYGGPTGLGAFTSSGRLIPLNVQVAEHINGGPLRDAPKLTDLKAGRLRPQDVGRCETSH